MTKKQIEVGKKWVEETLKKIAIENGLSLDILIWGVSKEGFDKGIASLVYFIGDNRYTKKFTENDLSDLAEAPDIRKKLEKRLRGLKKSKKA
jgi:hypothetical protein